jgi:glycosyltransferase involved in cell wall biosynthesis
MSFATFIIPTLGRPTLQRTLQSLRSQTDPDWTAIVLADQVKGFSLPVKDSRITAIKFCEKVGQSDNGHHHSGFVRNFGVGLNTSLWCAFVDDDDRLDPRYLELLKGESASFDLVIFRMRYSPMREDGVKILPRSNRLQDLGAGEVGISFAVRREFQQRKDMWFESEEFEDWRFIERCLKSGASCKISDAVLYYVRH